MLLLPLLLRLGSRLRGWRRSEIVRRHHARQQRENGPSRRVVRRPRQPRQDHRVADDEERAGFLVGRRLEKRRPIDVLVLGEHVAGSRARHFTALLEHIHEPLDGGVGGLLRLLVGAARRALAVVHLDLVRPFRLVGRGALDKSDDPMRGRRSLATALPLCAFRRAQHRAHQGFADWEVPHVVRIFRLANSRTDVRVDDLELHRRERVLEEHVDGSGIEVFEHVSLWRCLRRRQLGSANLALQGAVAVVDQAPLISPLFFSFSDHFKKFIRGRRRVDMVTQRAGGGNGPRTSRWTWFWGESSTLKKVGKK